MGLLTHTQDFYYNSRKVFTGDGTTDKFTISTTQSLFQSIVAAGAVNITNDSTSDIKIYVDNNWLLQNDPTTGTTNWTFQYTTADGWNIHIFSPPANGAEIVVELQFGEQNPILGGYQFTSLENIINQFIIAYVGEDKIISKIKRTDVAFHAQRALQELSFDTFKSTKSQEIEVPSTLTMVLPHDYVNYVKLSWVDNAGIERLLYPTSKTSNPKAIKQDSNGNYTFDIDNDGLDDTSELIHPYNSDTWTKYEGTLPIDNQDAYYDNQYDFTLGQRYGIDPQYSQVNGSFFIDELKGIIHFSSNVSGKTIILRYISDSLGTDAEMQVHKFAEEAMYKWIAYAILSTRANTPEYIIARFKKERFAEIRKAKLRLSNIKLEEITQAFRGKSKFIKH